MATPQKGQWRAQTFLGEGRAGSAPLRAPLGVRCASSLPFVFFTHSLDCDVRAASTEGGQAGRKDRPGFKVSPCLPLIQDLELEEGTVLL